MTATTTSAVLVPATTLPRPLRAKRIALPTGVTLPYVSSGSSTGVPVVLLHGVIDSWQSFATVLPHLPASIRAFALTQRGHGEADRPAAGYGMGDFAADVAASGLTVQHRFGSYELRPPNDAYAVWVLTAA